MRLNRVLALLAMAVATGVGLIWVEGQNLRRQQKLAELHTRRERLAEEQARLRVAIGRMAAPPQVIENLQSVEQSPIPAPVPTETPRPRGNVQPYLYR